MEISVEVQAELDNYSKELNKWRDENSPLDFKDMPRQGEFEYTIFKKLSPEAQKVKKEGYRNLQKRMKSQLQDDLTYILH